MSGPSPRAVFGLLRSQLTLHPRPVKSSFAGQTVIVTGGNAGLGKAAAQMVVELNAKTVIIAVRSTAKGEAAKNEIESAAKRDNVVQVWQLDLTDSHSIVAFGEKVHRLDRLDAVIMNAGIWPTDHSTAQGHELTLYTNVISTVLSAYLVLPKLQESSREFSTTTRLAFVGSNLHKFATLTARKSTTKNLIAALDEQELKTQADFDGRYNDTKLLLQMYGQRLASTYQAKHGDGVCITVLNPGYCYSGLKPPTDFGTRMFERAMARTTEEGAYCLVDAVALDKVAGRNGRYIDDQAIKSAAPWIDTAEGKQTGERLWVDLNAILDGIVPGVTTS